MNKTQYVMCKCTYLQISIRKAKEKRGIVIMKHL